MTARARYDARVSDPITPWLLTAARTLPSPEALWDAICVRLGDQMPLVRASLTVGTLHPQWTAWSLNWWRGEGVHREDRPHDGLASEAYLVSPVAWVHRRREELHHPTSADDFRFLALLRERGATDYFARPLASALDGVNVVSWATAAPDGFSADELAVLRAIEPALAAVFEVRVLQELTTTLMRTYLGRTTGEAVMRGRIRRGDGEPIRAVIWCSDLRGFTELSERAEPGAVIALLNDAFDAWAGAVHGYGGEVLKLMGDGMLAVFPIAPGDEAATCRRALAAAHDAEARIDAVSRVREAADEPPVRFGLGLHLGTVTYGNIGAPDRLDFTVIGPAVNRASRIEGLTKVLGRRVLVSGAVAEHVPELVVALGPHALKGVAEPVPVYAPLVTPAGNAT